MRREWSASCLCFAAAPESAIPFVVGVGVFAGKVVRHTGFARERNVRAIGADQVLGNTLIQEFLWLARAARPRYVVGWIDRHGGLLTA